VDSYGAHRGGRGQSRHTRGTGPLGFRELDSLFLLAENQIALLRRCQPTNAGEQHSLFAGAFLRGENADFSWRYAPAPNLEQLRGALERVHRSLDGGGALAGLYRERAGELQLEAELAECVGTPAFSALARRRHSPGRAPEWAEAQKLAFAWVHAARERDDNPKHVSDDRSSPDSLVNLLAGQIGRLRLPIRIEVSSSLGSRAASGDGVIFVQAALPLRRAEAWRITQHEIFGHALPRVQARAQAQGLFRVGSARASDDEEGRALAIEERQRLLDAERRRELGLRHLAALAIAEGANATECVRSLLGLGCSLRGAAAFYARSARGGGLCRELAYVPAWLRLKAVLAVDPSLERWLEHGRLSLDAARTLRDEGITPVGLQALIATPRA
jgi:hypothetical protein